MTIMYLQIQRKKETHFPQLWELSQRRISMRRRKESDVLRASSVQIYKMELGSADIRFGKFSIHYII